MVKHLEREQIAQLLWTEVDVELLEQGDVRGHSMHDFIARETASVGVCRYSQYLASSVPIHRVAVLRTVNFCFRLELQHSCIPSTPRYSHVGVTHIRDTVSPGHRVSNPHLRAVSPYPSRATSTLRIFKNS